MKAKVAMTFVCALFLVPLTSGCWDRREINDIAFVTAAAADITQDNHYRVTIQVPLPGKISDVGQKGGGGGSSGNKAYFLDSTIGDTFRAANAKQQNAMSRQLYFSHMRVFVFGEDLARENIASPIDVMSRIPQNRMTTYLLVSSGPAADLLNAQATMEKTPAEFLRELANESMIHPRTVKRVTEALLAEGQDPIMPVVSWTTTKPGDAGDAQTNLKLNGLAIFQKKKLVAMLSGRAADGVLWAMGEFRRPLITIPAKNGSGFVSVMVTSYHVRTTVKPTQDGRMVCQIQARVTGTLSENTSNLTYERSQNLASLERQASQAVTDDMRIAVDQLQRLHADPIGICNRVYRNYPGYWHRVKHNWRDEFYPNIPVQIDAQVEIRNSGNATSPVGIPEEELQS
ncbi:putative spore germination protein YfkR [Alicyclobacillus hesperidum]|uniref:Spore germination protein KC n=1 Tax=Alicyclobacillus hesperidum TaxID=89784 RepID=A0A1H2R2D4_9BACL|nr:Ger(x)C family spore germination protein [Alicyclobacillus hesperidum]GLV13219.1 putative spore germination protein YfkR [Alicyclobacillus hesperidum]SDW13290.1 spore germination protein KC [Alicyclobacillus hesperidum]